MENLIDLFGDNDSHNDDVIMEASPLAVSSAHPPARKVSPGESGTDLFEADSDDEDVAEAMTPQSL